MFDQDFSAEFFHLAVDQVRDAMLIMSLDGSLRYANRAAIDLYGFDKSELLKLNIRHLRAPDSFGELPAQMAKAMTQGILFECTHQNKSGATFHVEVSSRQIVIENTPYLISIVRDISDRLKTEQNLHFSQQLFDLFLEYSPIFVFVKDAQIRSVYLSRNYEQMLGMPLTEVLGKTMDELFPSEMAKKMIEDDKSVLREGKPCEVVEEFAGKTFVTTKFPIFVEGEAAFVAGFTMDITAQKKMEQSLLEKNLQLQTVIQMLPDLFYFKDMDRRYTIVNKALEDFVGLPAEAILSRHSEDILPAEWANQIRSSDEEAFLTGSLVRQEQQVEGPQQRWLDSFKVPLRDAQGNMIGIIGGSRDITERKRNELMLEERTAALEHSLLRLQKAWHQTIEVLASTSEAKDPYTAGHQKRVMQLAVSIGRELEMSEDALTGLRMAAMIHDIGKINVPGELLSKPGLLSPLERQLINTHATAGYSILKELDLPWNVAQVVKQHHERCDGSGYPDGLKKDQINFSARILAVADVVEAMASHRPYRPALGIERALAEIEQGAGTAYDETVAATCLTLFREKGFVFE